MHLKTFIAAAVVALTAACNQAEQAEQTEAAAVAATEEADNATLAADETPSEKLGENELPK